MDPDKYRELVEKRMKLKVLLEQLRQQGESVAGQIRHLDEQIAQLLQEH